ncbi:synaptotagmin-6 [Diabrotica virgifera virgifera]|uniref:C2 domain-containing protein n=1 Tax=Diabrotica virgifera virgifera TaxID=50390 RepID=A0ABM5JK63_DIAVI|nr:synaptotagmin-6 [Diabrotica virgifera virgifera]
MVGTAVFGAALGTGTALLIAMTIVVYKYYSLKKKSKEWHSLDKMPLPPTLERFNKPFYPLLKTEFNIEKEHLNVQPPQNSSAQDLTAEILKTPLEVCSAHVPPPALQHQSKSYPTGQPLLCRTPSVSSQSSLDSTASKQGHRGSSPQIRTFAPDGKTTFHHHHEATHTASYPLRTSSRSPSPLRAASLDIRCSSPGTAHALSELRTPSPSQSSLASLTGGSTSSCNSPVPASPRTGLGRCLSPLFIHRTVTVPDTTGVPPPASPLGAIQPDLYLRKDGPLFIAAPKSSPSLGRLHFRLSYDFDKSDLVVHLIEAHDLASSDQGGFNDPYVRLTLTPEVDSRKRQTNICRNDPNPLFDQHFKFPVSHEELQSKTLILQVFDYDRFSRNDIIGEVSVVMSEFDVANSVEIWGEITRNKKPKEDTQEILVSLSYLPSAERLTVVLLKARNLSMAQCKGNTDLQTFVKVYLIVNGKRSKKKKTATKKGSCNPVWNEALTFTLAANNVGNAAIELSVFDQGTDIIVNNSLIGSCTIGPKESGPEKDHWIDMTQSPRKAIACWHTVR